MLNQQYFFTVMKLMDSSEYDILHCVHQVPNRKELNKTSLICS